MAKVLVTGASGFIGTHLVAALAARGDEVTCLVRQSSRVDSLRQAGARFVFGDVTDRGSLPAAVAGQSIVYHLAGCTQALDPRHFYRVNQRGVANVAQVCAGQTTPPVLVSVSSLAAAGPANDGQPKTEADRSEPVSHYGHSKRAGERAAEHFADRVPITIVRPPIVLGEGDRLGLPLFRSIARFGVHMVPGLDRRRFSLIHADDLVQLLILAAERGKRLPPRGRPESHGPQGYYFAACEEDPAYADLGRMVAEVDGTPPRRGHSHGHAAGVDGGGGGRGHLADPPRSAVHEPRQSPRDHRRKLALFGRGGRQGVGFRRRASPCSNGCGRPPSGIATRNGCEAAQSGCEKFGTGGSEPLHDYTLCKRHPVEVHCPHYTAIGIGASWHCRL